MLITAAKYAKQREGAMSCASSINRPPPLLGFPGHSRHSEGLCGDCGSRDLTVNSGRELVSALNIKTAALKKKKKICKHVPPPSFQNNPRPIPTGGSWGGSAEELHETLPSVSTVAEAVGTKQRLILPFLSPQNQIFPFSTPPPPSPSCFSPISLTIGSSPGLRGGEMMRFRVFP